MDQSLSPAAGTAPGRQHARLAVRIGKRLRLTADVSVTPPGLVAIGLLVSSILLSTAVIVRTAHARLIPPGDGPAAG